MVIVPVSTISAWQQCFANWFPNANVVSLTGSKKDRQVIVENELLMAFEQTPIHRFHVLLTTPTIALIESEQLKRFKWRLLCIDEAHNIKNKDTKRNKVFSEFSTDAKLLLTGTPVSNNLNELFNLLHFLDGDLFRSLDDLEKIGDVDLFKDAIKHLSIDDKKSRTENELLNEPIEEDVNIKPPMVENEEDNKIP